MSEKMKWKPESEKRMGLRPHVVVVGIAFGLMAVAVGITWVAARLTRNRRDTSRE